jgi:hypothetical protein
MKRPIVLFVLIIISIGCTSKVDKKAQVLDSLKKAYADKPIHITLTNNPSGSAPITSQYAYTDKNKNDLAFRLESWHEYKLASEEGNVFVPTTDQFKQEESDMVLIEITKGDPSHKRGFIPYSFIEEFRELSYYK